MPLILSLSLFVIRITNNQEPMHRCTTLCNSFSKPLLSELLRTQQQFSTPLLELLFKHEAVNSLLY